jgi:hypothetical protein
VPRTYVTSIHGGAKVTHVGTQHRTVCNYVFHSFFVVTTEVPQGRTLCRRCAQIVGDVPGREGTADILSTYRGRLTEADVAARDAEIVALLKQGCDNIAVARHLGLGLRTAVRRIGEAQERAGATDRFTWGYVVGKQEAADSN